MNVCKQAAKRSRFMGSMHAWNSQACMPYRVAAQLQDDEEAHPLGAEGTTKHAANQSQAQPPCHREGPKGDTPSACQSPTSQRGHPLNPPPQRPCLRPLWLPSPVSLGAEPEHGHDGALDEEQKDGIQQNEARGCQQRGLCRRLGCQSLQGTETSRATREDHAARHSVPQRVSKAAIMALVRLGVAHRAVM